MGIGAYVSGLLQRQLPAVAAGQTFWRDGFDGVLLFVDIAESSALTERYAAAGPHGAEHLNALLDRYFGTVFDIVLAHGGDVAHVEGDAVLAVWRSDADGAAAAHRAAAAALALRDASAGRSSARDDTALRHRVALAAGPIAVAGLVEGARRGFLVVTGAPMHDLAALVHAGAPGEVMLGASIAEQLAGAAEIDWPAPAHGRLIALHTAPSPGVPAAAAAGVDGRLQRFLPPIVVERAAAVEAGWLAEFRMLSAVYVNLRGLDPGAGQAAVRIQRALGAIGAAIAPLTAGVSELVVGDKGVVAIIAIGLPGEAREHNAGRALEAARRVRLALADEGFVAAIGVASGPAFCGDVGSTVRRHYLVTGALMHRGARLMQAAGDDRILVDDATLQAVAGVGRFRFAPSAGVAVKGLREPLRAHRLEAPDAGDTRVRGWRSLHGRAQEVDAFERALDALAAGAGGVISIEAESGGGKSRLLDRLRGAAQARGAMVYSAVASPFEALEAYAGWRGLLRQLLARAGDAPRPAPALLRARLIDALTGDPAEAKAALVEDILPLQFGDPGLAGQIAGQARLAGLEELLAALLHRAAADQPIVVMIDDLQWLDDPSAQLASALARRALPVLWVVASRPPDGAASQQARRLLESAQARWALAPLAREAIDAIVCDLLRVQDIPLRLGDFIHGRCEGLPFHAEQLTLALAERGIVAVDDGRCRISTADLDIGVVPQNLRELIVGRLDRLDAAQQVTAKVASLIGLGVTADAVRALHPFPAEHARIEAMLAELAAASILVPAGDTAGPETYAFSHAMIREATYDLLTLAQRRPLHRQRAEFLERRHRDDLEPHLAELAEHWERAAEPRAAIGYRRQAASQALRRSANHDALAHIAHLRRVAADAGITLPGADEAELACMQGDACHELSRFEEAHAWYRRCAELSGIRVPGSRAALAAGIAAESGRQLAHRLGLMGRARDAAAQARDRLAAHIYTRLAEHAYFHGDAAGLLHSTLTALNRAERAAAVAEMVEGFGGLAIGFGTAGLHRLARFYRRRAVARAEQGGSLHDLGFAHLLSAVYSFHAGDWAAMDVHCDSGAALYARLGDRFRYQSCCVIRAYGDLLRGDYTQAERALRAFGEDAEQVDNVPVRAWVLAGRALVDMLLGRPPAEALRRVALARDDRLLHDAERLLCDGIEAAAQLQAGQPGQALRAAATALQNMRQSAPTMGIALFSVTAVADVYVTTAERAAAAGDADAAARLDAARAGCHAATAYARKIDICRPRERLLRGRVAFLSGRPRAAAAQFRKGIAEAVGHAMPLDEALCRLALAEIPGAAAEQQEQRRLGRAIVDRLGADPWLAWPAPAATVPRSNPLDAREHSATLSPDTRP
jgi:adenylate cyclase